MAAPPDLINDPPSLICRYKDRKTCALARASSLLSIAFVFFLLSSSCSIFSDVCAVTNGTKGRERKSDSEREKETNVYFGLAGAKKREKERIEREEDTFLVLFALKIYDIDIRN